MRREIIEWLETVTYHLDNITLDYGQDYVDYKMTFFRLFQNGKVFSTRFGANFFHETLARLQINSPIIPEKGQTLAEYDVNFNNWLKNLWLNT